MPSIGYVVRAIVNQRRTPSGSAAFRAEWLRLSGKQAPPNLREAQPREVFLRGFSVRQSLTARQAAQPRFAQARTGGRSVNGCAVS
jgi:hypothetical protein